jgi:beta-ketoacyl-acyl-carrier-protein synthase II
MNRVVISGMGVVSPLGNSCKEFFDSLAGGKSGVRKMPDDFAPRLRVRVGAPCDFSPEQYFPRIIARKLDRVSQLALVAAGQAIQDANPELTEAEKQRSGVYVGTGVGAITTFLGANTLLFVNNESRVPPLSLPMGMHNAPASHISMQYGLKGACLTYSTACSSSAIAIGEAFRLIQHGYSDVMVAGGAETSLDYTHLMAWESLGALAPEASDPTASCRPFSRDRAGIVLSDGAAMVLLESRDRALRRGAHIHAEIIGYGTTADATHITKPSEAGMAAAMQSALDNARIAPDSIGYINAHGTGTVVNDVAETRAIKQVFGRKAYEIPVSSTKSMHGHLLGAAGAIEFIASILSVQHQIVPPTINLTVPDPECDLDYVPGQARPVPGLNIAMSNSFAFGGTNAVLIVQGNH